MTDKTPKKPPPPPPTTNKSPSKFTKGKEFKPNPKARPGGTKEIIKRG